MVKNIFWDEDGTLPSADPAIRKMNNTPDKIQRQAGSDVLDSILNKIPTYFTGSRSKLEKIELETNMKYLIREGAMTYWELEKFFLSLGYNVFDVRKTFRNLTGIEPRHMFNAGLKDYINTPPIIPGLNLAWGVGKKGYDYAFVMPWKLGYAIFGQKGDLERKELSFFPTVKEALDGLDEYAKDVKTFRKNLTEDVLKKDEDVDMTLFTEAMNKNSSQERIALAIAFNEQDLTEGDISRMIEERKDSLTTEEQKELYEIYCPVLSKFGSLEGQIVVYNGPAKEIKFERDRISYKKMLTKGSKGILSKVINGHIGKVKWVSMSPTLLEERLSDLIAESNYKKSDMVPISPRMEDHKVEKELDEKTPQDYFDSVRDKVDEEKSPEHVSKILEYIAKKNAELREFHLEIVSFKYVKETPEHTLEETPQASNEGVDYFTSSAIISVLLNVIDLTLATDKNSKYALMVFFIKDDELTTTDTIKGEDDTIYSLTFEGTKALFAKERGLK
jgi:hypothetical protein